MKLVTYDDGRVGEVVDGQVWELDVPTMRRYFELGGEVERTGRSSPLDGVTLRAPILPKKFFHTAGNFREHHEESKNVNWSHPVLPWIVFFQNVDAIIGPDDAIVYPEALTSELDYELELAVVIGKAGKFFSPEEAADYIAGYLIFNDITARDIQREEMKSGVFCLSKSIDTFCPIGPWIVTPDEIPDPQRPVDGAPGQRRAPPELEHEPDVGDRPGDHQSLLGDGLQRRATSSPPAPSRASPASATTPRRCTSSPATWSRPRSRGSGCSATE